MNSLLGYNVLSPPPAQDIPYSLWANFSIREDFLLGSNIPFLRAHISLLVWSMTSGSSKSWIREDSYCLLLNRASFPGNYPAQCGICLRTRHTGAYSPEVSGSSNALLQLRPENTSQVGSISAFRGINTDRFLQSLCVGCSRGYNMVPLIPGPLHLPIASLRYSQKQPGFQRQRSVWLKVQHLRT